jgi:NAD+ synthase
MKTPSKKLNYTATAEGIVEWLTRYSEKSGTNGFVMGVSGGVDSAVVSTLCARTGENLLVIEMPIHQGSDEVTRAKKHIQWLKDNYPNVESMEVDLSDTYDKLYSSYSSVPGKQVYKEQFDFSMANTRSRLRMTTLYFYAGIYKRIVAGTGNKVEDFGIGFYTKYGDGGVDISPIGDLMKSEVRGLACELGLLEELVNAIPTDGLHTDGRTDEDQIGATYDELEWAMDYINQNEAYSPLDLESLSAREREVLKIYKKFNTSNKHKMDPIPVFNTSKFRN